MYKIYFNLILIVFLSSCDSEGYDKSYSKKQPELQDVNHTVDVSEALASIPKLEKSGSDNGTIQKLDSFYYHRNYCSYWFGTEKPTKQLSALNTKLRELTISGESSFTSYDDAINATVKSVYETGKLDTTALAEADLKITQLFVDIANSLLVGQLTSYSNGKAHWFVEDMSRDVLSDLRNVNNERALDSLLNNYRPNIAGYKALLEKFREIEAGNDTLYFKFSCDFLEWDSLASDSLTPKLAERLNQWGLITTEITELTRSHTSEALTKFQILRGLPGTGELDCETVRQLNMNKDAVLEKIALNLERLKTLPPTRGMEYILVNIPEYRLRIFKEDKLKFESRVIVGKEFNPTPVFVDTMTYLVFSPTWTVPQSIVHKEMIPNLQKDSEYYIKKNFKAYEDGEEINQKKMDWNDKDISSRFFVFVQQPGPSNSLGLVKFIMPNDMSIYLHDTPSDYLFDRTERGLSHGCIRLEKPKELAKYLLRDNEEWNDLKIEEAMSADEPKQVNLDKKIPTEIVYLTTWINADGDLAMFPDVYGHDAEQLKMLSEKRD